MLIWFKNNKCVFSTLYTNSLIHVFPSILFKARLFSPYASGCLKLAFESWGSQYFSLILYFPLVPYCQLVPYFPLVPLLQSPCPPWRGRVKMVRSPKSCNPSPSASWCRTANAGSPMYHLALKNYILYK